MELIILCGLILSGYVINNKTLQSTKKNNEKNNKKNKKHKKKLDNIQSNINIENNNNDLNIFQKNKNINKNITHNTNTSNLETINENNELTFNNNDNKMYYLNTNDNGFDGVRNYNKKEPEIVHSSLTGKSIKFKHNNMQPFYGSNVKQNMNFDKNRTLDLFTGGQYLKEPKKETGPLFQNEKQNVFGTQNYSSKYQDRINKSMYSSNTLPFDQIKVGPGVGLNYEDKPEGGFHQDIRQYELPKTIDELRTANNPRITYNGRIIKGKKEIKRDSDYNFTKYKKDPMYINREQQKTTGPQQNKYRSQVILQNTNRKISKENYGPAGNTILKGEKRSKFTQSSRVGLDTDTNRNFSGDTKYNIDKKAYNCLQTKREEQTVKPYNLGLHIGNLLKALIPIRHYDDKSRKTIKQTTQDNSKGLLNLKGGQKNQVYIDQKARKTIKQTTQDNTKGTLNLKGYQKNQLYVDQKARKTIKETTQDNSKGILNMKLYNKLPKRIQHKIRTTIKECLLHTPQLGNAKLISNDNGKKRDIQQLKKTLRETLSKDSDLLNLVGNLRHKKYLQDKAKITHKETYADNYTVGHAAQNNNDAYKKANYDMIETNKQTTCTKDYTGIANREDSTGYLSNKHEAKETNKETYADKDHYGVGQGPLETMSYEDMYNATINELKEQTLEGRAPTKESVKQTISSKDINLDIKCDLLREGPEPVLKNRIHNKIVDKTSIESTSNKNDLITDIIDYNEKNKLVDITEQLKSNPYSVSIV